MPTNLLEHIFYKILKIMWNTVPRYREYAGLISFQFSSGYWTTELQTVSLSCEGSYLSAGGYVIGFKINNIFYEYQERQCGLEDNISSVFILIIFTFYINIVNSKILIIGTLWGSAVVYNIAHLTYCVINWVQNRILYHSVVSRNNLRTETWIRTE